MWNTNHGNVNWLFLRKFSMCYYFSVLPILELNHKNKKAVWNQTERLQQHIITEQITAKAFEGFSNGDDEVMAVYEHVGRFSQQEFGGYKRESSNKCPFFLSKYIHSWVWTYTSLMLINSTDTPKAVYHGCRINFERLKLIHNSVYTVVRKIFVLKIFMCKMFMLKNFRTLR